jgi:mRNA interferase RelE/StbE
MRGGPLRVEVAPTAERQLRRLPPGDAARLRVPILDLWAKPYPSGSTKLAGTDFWRIRIGSLRLVYLVDVPGRRVVILRVARRSESTFRGLR